MSDRTALNTVSISSHIAGISERMEFDLEQPDEQPVARTQRYSIGEMIGKGGMGLVYQAHDQKFDRQVALKVLLQHYHHRDDSRERFFEEARTTARLQHPGIVSVYDMGISDDGQPFFRDETGRGNHAQ